MNQLMKRVLSVLLVVCLLCSALPSAFAAEGGGFTDVSKDHWAYDAIPEAVAAGYFKGVSDTVFDPEGTLTRAMLVTVLARAAGAETDDNASTGFSDVAVGTWYTGAVAWAAENGVVTGDGDGTFAPNRPTSTGEMLKLVLLSTGHKEQKPSTAHWASGYATYAYSMGFAAQNYSDSQLDNGISRHDVARFAAKALGYGASNTVSPFADVNDGYVTALYEAGVFIGTKVGDLTYFYPNSSITRAEVATIVYRIYQLSSLDQKQKIYYKDYTLDVLEGVPTNSYNKNAFVKNGSIMTYNDPSVRTRVGIDVSQYQGDVDWNAVARTDVDFVIARVGGRGYTVGSMTTRSLTSMPTARRERAFRWVLTSSRRL